MTIAATIASVRRARGLTQYELARLCCVSLRTIAFYEQSRRRPCPAVRVILERVLDVRLPA